MKRVYFLPLLKRRLLRNRPAAGAAPKAREAPFAKFRIVGVGKREIIGKNIAEPNRGPQRPNGRSVGILKFNGFYDAFLASHVHFSYFRLRYGALLARNVRSLTQVIDAILFTARMKFKRTT